jgi:hypothetical protein
MHCAMLPQVTGSLTHSTLMPRGVSAECAPVVEPCLARLWALAVGESTRLSVATLRYAALLHCSSRNHVGGSALAVYVDIQR